MQLAALDPVAAGAQQVQILNVVLAAAALEDDVVNLKDTERELAAASVAPAFLLAEEYVLVLPVRHRRVDIGGPEDVGAGGPAGCGTGRPWTAAGAC